MEYGRKRSSFGACFELAIREVGVGPIQTGPYVKASNNRVGYGNYTPYVVYGDRAKTPY